MSKPSVLISIQTYAETEDKAFGRSFMQSLLDEAPELTPELVSLEERYRDPFIDIDHFVKEWWAIPATMRVEGQPPFEWCWGPMWKRKSAPSSHGMVNHGSINIKFQRIPSSLWFESRWQMDVNFSSLFERWVELSRPDIGMLHLFTDAEQELLRSEEGSSFSCGSFGGPAKPGIPNIGWAMAYGPGHASALDVDGIRNAGFPVDVIGDAVVVRVTENLSDVVTDFPRFSRRRAELKRFFKPGVFRIDNEPAPDQHANSAPNLNR